MRRMRWIKNLIAHIFTKRNTKIFLFVFIVLWFFVGNSFAADSTNVSKDSLEMLSWLLNLFISILSWLWFIFAALAWKLMTNDLVYGSFINMDKVLWLLWNIMKNFANFALWFFFVFSIVKALFSSIGLGKKWWEDPMTTAKNTIKTTLIAWILIQMSWFLVWAAIDVSTVATAAVSSLPSQFISSSDSFKWKLQAVLTDDKNWIANWKQLVVDFNEASITTGFLTTGDDIDVNKILDTIVPSADSLVWPLMFLGVSIFDITSLSVSSHNDWSVWDWKNLFMELWISGFVVFTFTIMLALITLFNLFRVITLWIIIPMAPLIILLRFLLKEKANTLLSDSDLSGVTNIKNIFTLIFKPVYMVLILSVVLIVLSMIKWNVINKSDFNYNNIHITQTKEEDKYNSQMDLAWIVNVNMTWLKNTFVDLLVYIFGLILMFFLMKSCFSKNMTWIKFIDEKLGNLSTSIWWKQWEFWWLLWTMWVIPIWPNWDKVWIWTMHNALKNVDGDAFSRRILWSDYASKQNAFIQNWLGTDNDYFEWLSTRSNSRNAFIESAVSIWKSNYWNNFDKFWVDSSFSSELSKWNRNHKDNQDIDQDIVRKYWDNAELPDKIQNSKPEDKNDNDNPQSE